ncbi:MAG TPA: PilT/PilU family type 4a pilus ATPase [Acidimicrobiia bacterium]
MTFPGSVSGSDRLDTTPIDAWLETMIGAGASDLLITGDSAPRMRVDGRLTPILGTSLLEPGEAHDLVQSVLSDDQRIELRRAKEIDLAFSWRDGTRFRANAFFQRGCAALSMRRIPSTIPSFSKLGVPEVLRDFCTLPQGLVLMTGPTGSGKSTTLAAMVDHVNATRECHVITIEDPIEYVHRNKLAVVNQREVGVDTDSFESALRAALREDPDVILVGELRDLETIQFALTAAETGHLVFATLHTNDAAQAIDRVIDVFPVDRQSQVRVQLAACLAGVAAQRLIPRIGGGMVAAVEVLGANPAIRNVIRDGKTHQLRNVVVQCQREGMSTLERALNELVARGTISFDDARARAVLPNEIKPAQRAA